MKTRGAVFALAGVALLLLVVYAFASWRVNLAPMGANNSVWDLTADSITRIAIRHPGENGDYLIFEKSDQSGWQLASPSGIAYDQALANGLPLTLSYVKKEKVIAVNPVSLSEYGLDKPVVVDAFTTDGTEHKLLLGNETSSGTSRYFSLDNVTVYTMDESEAQAIALDSLTVRDKNVLKLNRSLSPKDIASKITRLRFLKGDTLILEAERGNDGSWQHNGNPLAEETAATAAALSDAISRLTAYEFIRVGNLENYHLDSPQYTIEFENENGTQTLLLGDPTPDGGSFYACVSGSNTVFTVSNRGFTFLK